MASLFDPEMKLRWAKKHLGALAAEVDAFRKTNTYRVSAEEDPANGWYVVRFQLPHDERVFTIALIAADFIASLRCCLDHLAWQLALLSGQTPSRDISFPICEKDSVDTQIRIAKATYGIPDAAVAVMKAFQPYKYGDAYKSTHLWRLHNLWNIDKHRHIVPHGVASDWFVRLESKEQVQINVEELEDGQIVRFPLALKEKVHLNPNPGPPDVRFGWHTEKERDDFGLDELFQMHQFVADTVLPAFACFFAQPKTTGQT